jgi:Carboxypeptidase regulatory-like domain/TonB-dependent Receptor Plug Domain
MIAGIRRLAVLLMVGVFAFPLAAAAQSSIAGEIRDESGAVLPGVTVEAASPALIEKVRTVTTDSQGRYSIANVRPGVYRVSCSLPGFSSVVREGVELPADFTTTINFSMKIGSLEETITVAGASPVVDVQQASRTQVLTRDLIDSLPTSRNIMSVGQLVPGVRQAIPDVGGSRTMEQTGMRMHGISERNTTQTVDGMQVNSNENNGTSLTYLDDALNQEVSITTSALPADTSSGGARINTVPKDGGNKLSGAVFIGGTDGSWQSDNLDDEIRARGVTIPNRILHIQNYNASVGGPILQDRLWYFGAARHTSTDDQPANTFTNPDGTPGIEDQHVRDAVARLTWQMAPKIKVASFLERIWKFKGHEFTFGTEPSLASKRRDPAHGNYALGQGKVTATPTNRLLIEGGYSTYKVQFTSWYQDGVAKTPFSPEWYANASRVDTVRGTTTIAGTPESRTMDQRHVIASSASYVTGSHNFKTGVQWSFGPDDTYRTANADLTQNYRDGVANTVTVYNTPNIQLVSVRYDLGIYLQDSWTFKRLTANPGVRFELFNSGTRESSMAAGRFTPARFYSAVNDLPNWRNVAPRFSAAYDVFGDGRTAIKGSVSKYYATFTGSYVKRYADSISDSDTRNWFDVDLVPGTSTASGRALPSNGDNIAQDNEIGPPGKPNFGQVSNRRPADGLSRFYNWEYTASIQRELRSGVSVTAAYFRRTYGDLEVTRNLAISTADYIPFQIPNPLDAAEQLTVYNLSPAKRGLLDQEDQNSRINQQIYNGIEMSFSARLGAGALVFGGWTMDQNIAVTCDTTQDPNGIAAADLYTNRTVMQGGPYCDQRDFGIPFRHEFKLAGSYPLPLGLEVGAVFQSYPGYEKSILYQVPANLFPGSRTNVETVVLNKPGTLFQPRMNQVDANVKKNFRIGGKSLSGQVDIFNLFNGNAVLTSNENFGTTYDQVNSFLQGRLFRLAVQLKF